MSIHAMPSARKPKRPICGDLGTVAVPMAAASSLRARARARRVVPISELVFGALTENRSSLEPSLGFATIARHAALWIAPIVCEQEFRARGRARGELCLFRSWCLGL